MGKVRLYKDDRLVIRAALVKHKMAPLQAAHEAAGYALAAELWEHLHGEYKRLIDKLPPGALPETTSFSCRAYGKYVPLYFGGGAWDDRPKRRVFDKYERHFDLPVGDLAQRIDAWGGAGVDLNKQRDTLATKTDATLNGFRTFDDLLAAWPEAEKFITKRWRDRPEYAQATLPAVVLSDLSKALDLPPEEMDEAA